MIAGTYIISGVGLAFVGYLFQQDALTATQLTIGWSVIFFFASAGASSAYLTVSEIFPMETRAMAIAFFYAVGDRHRRHHRAGAVRPQHRHRQPHDGVPRLPAGRRADGAGRPHRGLAGRRRRAGDARGHRPADHRGVVRCGDDPAGMAAGRRF